MPHRFTYPRCPKTNGCIECYQRTLQEELVDVQEVLMRDPQQFDGKLADYLIFYNGRRKHPSLRRQAPLAFWVAHKGMSKRLYHVQCIEANFKAAFPSGGDSGSKNQATLGMTVA